MNLPITKNISLESDEGLAESFLRHLNLKGLSGNTVKSYAFDLSMFIAYVNARKQTIYTADANFIYDFFDYLYRTRGNSMRTISRKYETLKSIYAWLMDTDRIEYKQNPMRNIKPPKFSRKIPDAPDMDDVRRILSVIDRNSPRGLRDFVAVSLLAESGMRIGSLVKIKLTDINVEQKTCIIWVKGNKYNIEYCSKKMVDLLHHYIKNVRHILASSIKSDYLFINHSGKQITTRFLSRQIKLYAKQAGVRMSVTAHALRHFVAQDIIWNGGDLSYAQEKLNHSSIQVTKDIYGKLPSKRQREIMDRMRPNVLGGFPKEILAR